MFRITWFFLLLGLAFVVSCSPGGEDSTPSVTATEDVHAESWRESRMLAGQETYEAVCASCHDQGEGNAPVVGDGDTWSARSDLWVAVLSEHANSGYLEMPEKGGHSELTEDAVAAATEFMLAKTFPELLQD